MAQESLNVKGEFNLTTSNHIFVDEGFSINPDYAKTVGDTFNSTPVPIRFRRQRESAKTINEVVKEATNGLISEVVEEGSLDSSTTAILISAIHFKGDWMSTFDEELTSERDFQLADGTTTKVQTMYMSSHFSLTDVPELESQAIRIPYKDDRLSMVVILPNKVDGLSKVEESLPNFDLSSIHFGSPEQVELSLPRFKVSSDLKLNENLKKLGVREIFDDDADFSRMTSADRDIYVSSVVQKAIFEVNEKGSEAAAAASATIEYRTSFFASLTFNIDHPFMFFLKDDLTGLTLFSGRVANPNQR